ncbi:hypothetical protein ACROYT_G043405 [Oculina patagonica]
MDVWTEAQPKGMILTQTQLHVLNPGDLFELAVSEYGSYDFVGVFRLAKGIKRCDCFYEVTKLAKPTKKSSISTSKYHPRLTKIVHEFAHRAFDGLKGSEEVLMRCLIDLEDAASPLLSCLIRADVFN